jgi:hypothetical protein
MTKRARKNPAQDAVKMARAASRTASIDAGFGGRAVLQRAWVAQNKRALADKRACRNFRGED